MLKNLWLSLFLLSLLLANSIGSSSGSERRGAIPEGTWDRWAVANKFSPPHCLTDKAEWLLPKTGRKIRQRQLALKSQHSAECAAAAKILLLHKQGSASSKDVVSAIFGKETNTPLPAWTWQCFWDGMLAAMVHENAVNGQWLPVREVAEEDAFVAAQNHSAQWPLLLKGMAKQILNETSSHVWQSDEDLAKMFPAIYEFKGCDAHGHHDVYSLSVSEWLLKSNNEFLKTNNWRLWSEPDKADEYEAGEAVIPKYVAQSLLIPGRLPNEGEITLNWARHEGVRHLPLHHDSTSQMACQVAGEKTWVLVPPEATGHITNLEYLRHNDGRSDSPDSVGFDPFDANGSLYRFPDAEDKMPPPLVVRVKQGDCIKMPALWWHATESHGRSISVNFQLNSIQSLTGGVFDLLWPMDVMYLGGGNSKYLRQRWQSPTEEAKKNAPGKHKDSDGEHAMGLRAANEETGADKLDMNAVRKHAKDADTDVNGESKGAIGRPSAGELPLPEL